jgi:hypothetical protein
MKTFILAISTVSLLLGIAVPKASAILPRRKKLKPTINARVNKNWIEIAMGLLVSLYRAVALRHLNAPRRLSLVIRLPIIATVLPRCPM